MVIQMTTIMTIIVIAVLVVIITTPLITMILMIAELRLLFNLLKTFVERVFMFQAFVLCFVLGETAKVIAK